MLASVSISPLSVSDKVPASPAVMVWSRAVIVPATAVGVPPVPFLSWSKATSLVTEYPITVAVYVRPLPTIRALIAVAFSMTWLFVSTRPDEESTMPVPAAAPPWANVVSMSTMAGSTCDAMADVLTPAGELPDPDPDPRPEAPGVGLVPRDGELLAEGSTARWPAGPPTPGGGR